MALLLKAVFSVFTLFATCLNVMVNSEALSYWSLSFCSEPEAVDQPQASAQAPAGDGKEYTQISSPESVNLSKPQEAAFPSQNKGERRRNEETR